MTTTTTQELTTMPTSTGFRGLTAADTIRQSEACHPDWTAETHLAYLQHEEGFSHTDANAAVQAWLSGRVARYATPSRPSTRPANVRPNRYAAACETCGEMVAEGAGRLDRSSDGRERWIVQHLTPADCTAAEDAAVERAANTVAPVVPVAERYTPASGEFHLIDGELYRVVKGRQSGNLYAKRAQLEYSDCPCDVTFDTARASCPEHGCESRFNLGWEYVGKRPFRSMTADTLVTWEQARTFGTLTSRCIRCDAELGGETNESEIRSVAAGYGQTCARRMGWPYPSLAEAREMIAERTAR